MQNHVKNDIIERLRAAGLRPTQQRQALAGIIFGNGHRHIAAEDLLEEVLRAQIPVSLATIYNTLHQFKDAGLLRMIAVEGNKTYFDTNTSDHHHFFIEGANQMIDIDYDEHNQPIISNLPQPPEGMEIANIDLIVRLKPAKKVR